MFKRSFGSKERAGKTTKASKWSFRDDVKEKMLAATDPAEEGRLTSAIVTIAVGPDRRLFAAHEDVLCHSPYFATAVHDKFFAAGERRISLPGEEPEVFSCVLEYLYKGDYSPRLLHDKRRNTWALEGNSPDLKQRQTEPTIFLSGDDILRDTAVYCAAGRYGLAELQRLALRKQGLQSGIEVGVILRSARYAYENTPDNDSRLRAHYLALIIRSRKTFKRSGTMQMEMECGGRLFFDLFVAMCNHMDDLVEINNSPRTV